jgi:hypothetical protein
MIALPIAFRNATKTQDTYVYLRAFPSQVYKAPLGVTKRRTDANAHHTLYLV